MPAPPARGMGRPAKPARLAPMNTPPGASDLPVTGLLEQAQQALQAQRWAPALALAQQALAEPALPDDARIEALLLVAQSQWRQGDLLRVHRPALQAAALARRLQQLPACIRGLTLAAFALGELSLADEALPLALEALTLARQPGQHGLLPGALSCAAHVYARLCDLEHAEGLHMQALSLAREAGAIEALHQAYANLIASFIVAHKELLASGQEQAAQAALARARRYASHARSLLDDARLDEYRRFGLMLNLGHLLTLAEQLDEAEPLLRAGIALAHKQAAGYYLLSGEASLAELLLKRGRPAEALPLLHAALHPEPGQGGFSLQLSALRTALACRQALGDSAAAQDLQAELDAALRARAAMREQAQQSLSDPGRASSWAPL